MKKLLLSVVCIIGISISADQSSTFDVKGMMCGNGCVKKINRAMDSMDGIKSRQVNFEKSSMIITALKENNYSCSLKENPEEVSPFILFFKNLFN